jgi:hypothetical protein
VVFSGSSGFLHDITEILLKVALSIIKHLALIEILTHNTSGERH